MKLHTTQESHNLKTTSSPPPPPLSREALLTCGQLRHGLVYVQQQPPVIKHPQHLLLQHNAAHLAPGAGAAEDVLEGATQTAAVNLRRMRGGRVVGVDGWVGGGNRKWLLQ